MPEKKKIGVRFVERGNKVLMKQDHPDFMMDDREVLIQIGQLENAITKAEQQLEHSKQQQIQFQDGIKYNNDRLKDLKKFEKKMVIIQESKARVIFSEIKEECRKKVDKDYTPDDALTEDQNNKQKWRIYQQTVATHKRVAKELAPKIMQKMYYKEHILDKPWG